MVRPTGPLTRCGGKWTEAKFRTFVKNLIRGGTMKWGPKIECIRNAKVSRGLYKCQGCGAIVPPTIVDPVKKKRVKNIFADHIEPIVDPSVGFTNWDDFIERTFCESDNFQALCKKCHDGKSKEERDIATERRREEKLKNG